MRLIRLGLAAGALAVARFCLRHAPGRSVRWAAADRRQQTHHSGTPDVFAGAVASIGSRMQASCLEQGLALVMLLAVARVPARLVIGVSRPGSTFAAHAWVESRGRVVLGGAQAHDFVALPSVAALPCRG
jgi:hypothetical protein